MIIMYMLGILFSLSAIIISVKEGNWGWVILMLLLLLLSICGIAAKQTAPQTKTIRCERIEQIDTLYKNDSIVGYEITYRE